MNEMSIGSLHCLGLQGSPLRIYAIPVFLIGAYALIDGICAVIAGAKLRSEYRLGSLLIAEGMLRFLFVATLVVLLNPIGPLVLMLLIVGAIEIGAAIQLRRYVNGVLFFALAGIASVLILPIAMWSRINTFDLLGGYEIIFGALLLVFGLSMSARGRPGIQP